MIAWYWLPLVGCVCAMLGLLAGALCAQARCGECRERRTGQ